MIVSSLTVWVKRQVVNEDRWTNASGRLLEDPAIRTAVSKYLVNELFTRVDVEAELQSQLPEKTQPLARPLAGALREVSIRSAETLLARPETISLWKDANRITHRQLMSVLDGGSVYVSTVKGEVVLDLRPLLERIGNRLIGEELLPALPAEAGKIVVLQSDELKTAQKATKALRALSVLLSLVALALAAAAVWLAPDRRRMVFWVGIAAVIAGLVVLVSRRLGGNYLTDALTADTPDVTVAARAAWAITTELLRNSGITLILYGIAIAFAAVLAGPTRLVTAIRRFLAPTLERRPLPVFGAVIALFLATLLVGPTDAQRLVPLIALFAGGLVGVEALRRQTRREFPLESGTP